MKVRKRTYLKLPTKFFNNLYLGGSQGPSKEDLQALKALMPETRAGEERKNIPLTAYLMQWSYATNTPGTSDQAKLPGAATTDNSEYPYYVYKKVQVAEGQSLLDCLEKFRAIAPATDNLWSAYVTEQGSDSNFYLDTFYRGDTTDPEVTYSSNGDGKYFYPNGDPAPMPLIPGKTYVWKGWGVMFNSGKGAPATTGGFTEKTLGEVTITPTAENVYTFIYAQTEYTFEYHETQVHLILSDKTEEMAGMAEEALQKSRELFDSTERGIVELLERAE